MKAAPILAVLIAAAPVAALAQVEHSQATIIAPTYAAPAPGYPSAELASCADRQDALERTKNVLDDERVTYDRERDQLDSEAASLAAELRQPRLDRHRRRCQLQRALGGPQSPREPAQPARRRHERAGRPGLDRHRRCEQLLREPGLVPLLR